MFDLLWSRLSWDNLFLEPNCISTRTQQILEEKINSIDDEDTRNEREIKLMSTYVESLSERSHARQKCIMSDIFSERRNLLRVFSPVSKF